MSILDALEFALSFIIMGAAGAVVLTVLLAITLAAIKVTVTLTDMEED